MPKDPPRNQPNYKIGGDHINEYEYQSNKGQITKEEDQFPRPQEIAEGADLLKENNENAAAEGAAEINPNARNNS